MIRAVFYSNFLSSSSCNFQCKVAKAFVSKGYSIFRTTVYNTVQHSKKFVQEELVFHKIPTSRNSKTIEHFQRATQKKVDNMRSVLGKIRGTKIRQEFYFVPKAEDSIEDFKQFCKFIIDEVSIGACDENELLLKMQTVFQQ